MKHLMMILPFLLSACSSDRESFPSEPGTGFGWRSMRENHERIQEMSLPVARDIKAPVIPGTPYAITASPWPHVERLPEQYLRIWIPAHQDAEGNLHEEHAIHTIIQPGQWVIPGQEG